MKKKKCWKTIIYQRQKIFPFMMVETGVLHKGKLRVKSNTNCQSEYYHLSAGITPSLISETYSYKRLVTIL